ncbi:MAG: ABC transporter substrate-binding protein [Deltaproteobacteria bacterium]|nr:ABC transporter substrate-binding protein [Deltaproteobacteria bacterium]
MRVVRAQVRAKQLGLLSMGAIVSLAMTGCKEETKPAATAAMPGEAQKATGGNAGRPKMIMLGQPAAFTGPSAGLGIEMWRGAKTAFLEYNARPTTSVRVDLITADDGYDAAKAPAAVTKLAEDSAVFALFGGVGTPTMVKALPIVQSYYKKNKLFYFSNFTGAQAQREPPYSEFVFNVRASYRDETKALVDYLSAQGRTKIGIYIQDDAYGESGKDGVVRALTASGRELAAEARYPRGQEYSVANTAQIKTLKDARVDAIIAVGAYQACAGLIRDARKAGWNVPIANLSFVGSDQLLKILLQEETESGTPMIVNVINSQVVPSYNAVDNLIVSQYRTAIDKFKVDRPDFADKAYQSDSPYSFGSFEGYVSARAFIAVLEEMKGDITRENFIKTAESMGAFNIGLNTLTQFGPDRHQALDNVWLTYATKDGWQAIDPRAKILQ